MKKIQLGFSVPVNTALANLIDDLYYETPACACAHSGFGEDNITSFINSYQELVGLASSFEVDDTVDAITVKLVTTANIACEKFKALLELLNKEAFDVTVGADNKPLLF